LHSKEVIESKGQNLNYDVFSAFKKLNKFEIWKWIKDVSSKCNKKNLQLRYFFDVLDGLYFILT